MSMKNVNALLVGAAVGAVIGILFAPEKGSKTREKIKDGLDDLKDKAKSKIDLLDDETKERIYNAKDDLTEKVESKE